MLKLYLISQNVNNGYDTFSAAVVCAENEEDAKRVHPHDGFKAYFDEEKKQFWTKRVDGKPYLFEDKYETWTNDLKKIRVEYLGEVKEGIKKGVICSSFHAG